MNFPSLNDIAEAKTSLRKTAKEQRMKLGAAVRAEKSAQACAQFLSHIVVGKNQTVALYWPMGDELDCRRLIQELAVAALPTLVGSEKPLIFRQFESVDRLVPAAYGTHEPGQEAKIILPDIIVLPLLAFDKTGARLGYGGGFYDRTIAAMKTSPKIVGLAFDAQENDFVPIDSHDKSLDIVVTESGVRKF